MVGQANAPWSHRQHVSVDEAEFVRHALEQLRKLRRALRFRPYRVFFEVEIRDCIRREQQALLAIRRRRSERGRVGGAQGPVDVARSVRQRRFQFKLERLH